MDVKLKLGKRLKELRLAQGYSQESFANSCGLDRTYIASIENGKRNVSIKNIELISNTLNITLSNFFDSELFHGN